MSCFVEFVRDALRNTPDDHPRLLSYVSFVDVGETGRGGGVAVVGEEGVDAGK